MRLLLMAPLLLTFACRNKDAEPPVETGAVQSDTSAADDTGTDDTGTDDTGVADSDGDGVPDDEDCAPEDPDAYPGGAEIPYNGVDDDCDETTPDDDLDGDGAPAVDDCDDGDASAYPDAPEICDGIDNDCDGEIDDAVGDVWYEDLDGDGFGDPDAEVQSCDGGGDLSADGSDCDDANADVNPGADEVCDGIDNDCDGETDADAADASTWYVDVDGDGYGVDGYATTSCDAPAGYAASAGDCDDGDAAYNPGAAEDDCADPNDYNCDGVVGYADTDGDGYAACEDCDDGDAEVNPDSAEVCDGVDNDCDGDTDEDDADDAATWYADDDGDSYGDPESAEVSCDAPSGYVTDDADCDDGAAEVNPGADEVCDGIDNDCDGDTDEDDADDAATWYADGDGDGYGDPLTGEEGCAAPSGYIADGSDCDDNDAEAYPGQEEICDLLDNDCDGDVDEAGAADASTWYADGDADGYGDDADAQLACYQPGGYAASGGDCDDGDAAVNPGADEVCDGGDDDCDGAVDEDAVDAATWYADGDGDGYGDPGDVADACDQPTGYVSDDQDCDDDAPDLNPDTVWYLDYDGDGYGADVYATSGCEAPSSLYVRDGGDCDDEDDDFNPDAAGFCDDQDHDCDGAVDSDDDGDGYADATCGGSDCDDDDADVKPEPDGGCALGADCLEILAAGYGDDDVYSVDPDGYGTGEDPEDVYCDMTTDGGGWTLIAVNAHTGFWSTDRIQSDGAYGDPELDEDYQAAAFSSVRFTDLLFRNDDMYAIYDDVSDDTLSWYDFQAAVPTGNCGTLDGYEWSMSDGDLSGSTLCSTNLYLHPSDDDGPNYFCGESVWNNPAFGPAWSVSNNDGCPLDDPSSSAFISSGEPWGSDSPLLMFVR